MDAHQAPTVLWLSSLALPYLVFAIHNPFRRRWLTFLRALAAIGVGWAAELAYAIAANAISRASAATPEELAAFHDGDGAKLAAAAVLGWIMPAGVVVAGWILHGFLLPNIRSAWRIHKRGFG